MAATGIQDGAPGVTDPVWDDAVRPLLRGATERDRPGDRADRLLQADQPHRPGAGRHGDEDVIALILADPELADRVDGFPEGGQWSGHPGPLWSLLSRPDQDPWDAEPDDGGQVDLAVVPEFTFIAPRLSISIGEAMACRVSAATAPADLVAEVSAELAAVRAREIAKLDDRAACVICGDHYPARHLLAPTVNDKFTVCPSCVLDGDLVAQVHPTRLALEIDRPLGEDLAIQAGWSAVAALLAHAGGQVFASRLGQAGGLCIPAEHWADPSLLWIWLPPGPRPAALAGLGPGAGLKAVVDAVEHAHPGLRALPRGPRRRP